MIRSTENQEKKFYIIAGGEWEAAVLAKDAIDAAAYGLEKAFESSLFHSNIHRPLRLSVELFEAQTI